MRYTGGKGAAGLAQAIINRIPPHATYIEAFAGGANVYERLQPAARAVLIERDPLQVAALAARHPAARVLRTERDLFGAGVELASLLPAIGPGLTIVHGCALAALRAWPWRGDEFLYCDPPYLMTARRSGRALYRVEFGAEAEHAALLAMLASVPAPWALSGYRSPLYDAAAQREGWERIDVRAMTRRGPALESVWFNRPAPAALHDARYAGGNFRERERIKRKVGRWRAKLARMDRVERAALLAAIREELGAVQLPPNMQANGRGTESEQLAKGS